MRATCKMAAKLLIRLIVEGRDATTNHVHQLKQSLSAVTRVLSHQDPTRSVFFTVIVFLFYLMSSFV